MTELLSLPPLAVVYVLLTILVVVVTLLVVVTVIAHTVVRRARPEDLPQVLPGLGQVLDAFAQFLPWRRGRGRIR